MAESTTKISLQKHEKDLRTIEDRMGQIQNQVNRNFEQTKNQFGSVEEQISNLNQQIQSSNEELVKRITEVLEAVHSSGSEKTRPMKVSTHQASIVTTQSFNNSNIARSPTLIQNHTPSSVPCFTSVISKPHIPTYLLPYNLTPINSSTNEPYTRPMNFSSPAMIDSRYPPSSVTPFSWLSYTEIPQTLGPTFSIHGSHLSCDRSGEVLAMQDYSIPFSGSDPYGFIQGYEEFFKVNPMTEVDMIQYVMQDFEGEALEWYYEYVEEKFMDTWTPDCWEDFVAEIYRRFQGLKLEHQVFVEMPESKSLENSDSKLIHNLFTEMLEQINATDQIVRHEFVEDEQLVRHKSLVITEIIHEFNLLQTMVEYVNFGQLLRYDFDRWNYWLRMGLNFGIDPGDLSLLIKFSGLNFHVLINILQSDINHSKGNMRSSGKKFLAEYCSCEGDTTKIDVAISIEVKAKHITKTDTGGVTLAETHNHEKEVSTETVTSSGRKSIKEGLMIVEREERNKIQHYVTKEVIREFMQLFISRIAKVDPKSYGVVHLQHAAEDERKNLDMIHLESLIDMSKLDCQQWLFIFITLSKASNILTIIGSVTGMTKTDLVNISSTVERSGTMEFKESHNLGVCTGITKQYAKPQTVNIVVEKAIVTTNSNEDEHCIWESQTGGYFTVTRGMDDEQLDGVITLFFKEDHLEYLKEGVLLELMKKYSEFNGSISLWAKKADAKGKEKDSTKKKIKEVSLEWQLIDKKHPIWMCKLEEITKNECASFYNSLIYDWEEYLAVTTPSKDNLKLMPFFSVPTKLQLNSLIPARIRTTLNSMLACCSSGIKILKFIRKNLIRECVEIVGNEGFVMGAATYILKSLKKKYNHFTSMEMKNVSKIRSLQLDGQPMTCYFQQEGFSKVASHFRSDDGAYFNLAIENGNTDYNVIVTTKEDDKKFRATIKQYERNNPWGKEILKKRGMSGLKNRRSKQQMGKIIIDIKFGNTKRSRLVFCC